MGNMIIFYLLIIVIIIQRFIELIIANKNERWMKAHGGIEIGNNHYKWFILLHILFFVSLLVEFHLITIKFSAIVMFQSAFFTIFLLAQLVRVWCMYSLGKFWNTKIIILPKITLIKKGPYKFIKHPNYIIVFIELLVIPLMFNLYVTATLFPFLHLLLLTVRIPLEDEALGRSPSIK